MIVPVQEENEGLWARLCNALWPHHATAEFLERRSKGRQPHEFLYMLDGEAIAFLSLSLRADYVEGAASSPVGYIEGIYVKPEFRKDGIGRKLVEFAKKWSQEKGCTEMASDCEIENQSSRDFHNAIGFREANVIVHFTMGLKEGQ